MGDTKDLTAAMRATLERAVRIGWVYAGNDTDRGRVVRTSSSTLLGLERRGLVTVRLGVDGMIAEPTAAGREAVRQ